MQSVGRLEQRQSVGANCHGSSERRGAGLSEVSARIALCLVEVWKQRGPGGDVELAGN